MYDLIRNIIEEDTLSIELVVLNSSQKENLSLNEENNNINRFKKIKRELNKSYLFFDYLKWDKTYYKEDFDAKLYLDEAKKFSLNCKPKKKILFKYQYEKNPQKYH